jgi:ATP-dependent DNA helicase RecQ
MSPILANQLLVSNTFIFSCFYKPNDYERRSLNDPQRVPAYIVFSDVVLLRMTDRRPPTTDDLFAISGVGPAKLARHGLAFLEAMREFNAETA